MSAVAFAAIFDLDGTLVDSYDAHFEAWRLISARHGVAVTVDDYYAHFGRRNEDLLRECWRRAGRGAAWDAARLPRREDQDRPCGSDRDGPG